MFKTTHAFSSFSVDDLEKAQEFYGGLLGLQARKTDLGLEILVPDNAPIFVYQKDNHVPATFTILNLIVEDIDEAVDSLTQAGVVFEHYEGEMQTDQKGIMRGHDGFHTIAWFKDPAGNFISLIVK